MLRLQERLQAGFSVQLASGKLPFLGPSCCSSRPSQAAPVQPAEQLYDEHRHCVGITALGCQAHVLAEMGSIRVVSANGGKGRVITSEKGHYREPSFAPNGRALVYRKGRGGWLLP